MWTSCERSATIPLLIQVGGAALCLVCLVFAGQHAEGSRFLPPGFGVLRINGKRTI